MVTISPAIQPRLAGGLGLKPGEEITEEYVRNYELAVDWIRKGKPIGALWANKQAYALAKRMIESGEVVPLGQELQLRREYERQQQEKLIEEQRKKEEVEIKKPVGLFDRLLGQTTKISVALKQLEKPVPPVPLGVAVLKPYVAPTPKELKEAEKLERISKIERLRKTIGGYLERVMPPKIDIAPKYGEGWGMITPPPVIDVAGILPYETRGTVIQRTITKEELEKMKFYEEAAKKELEMISIQEQFRLDSISKREAEKISEELIPKTKIEINNEFNRLQLDVNEGKISVEEAQNKLDRYVEKINKSLEKEFEMKHSEVIAPYVQESTEKTKKESERLSKNLTKSIDKRDFLPRFVSGVITGALYTGVGIVAPPIGAALGGIFTTKAIIEAPEIVKYAKERPLAFGAEVGGLAIGAGITGFVGKRILTRAQVTKQLNSLIEEGKLSKVQATNFKKYMAEIRKIESATLGKAPVKKVDFSGMERFPSKLHVPTKNYIKAKGDILGGSIAMRSQLGVKVSKMRFAQSDLDIYTTGNVFTRANELANIWKGQGIKRISVVPNTGRITIAGIKVVEFHPTSMLYANIRTVSPIFRPVKLSVRKSPEGIKVAPTLDIQAMRKLVGGYMEGRYSKDIPDFLAIRRSMLERLQIQERAFLPEKILIPKKKITPLPIDIDKVLYKSFGFEAIPKVKPTKVPTPIYPKYPVYPTTFIPPIYPVYKVPKIPKAYPVYKVPDISKILLPVPIKYIEKKPMKIPEIFLIPKEPKYPIMKYPAPKIPPIKPYAPMKIPKIYPIIRIPIPPKKLREEERRKLKARLKQEKIRTKQLRAYQASVAAVSLGIEMKPEKIKEIEKRLTGLEIRPVVRERDKGKMARDYTKQLNKLFS